MTQVNNPPDTLRWVHIVITAVVMMFALSGCSKDHLDPTQIGRFRSAPAVNIILDSLGVSEETASVYEGAEDPKPADLVEYERDYAFSSGDIIRISIFELLRESQPYVDDYVVTESGNISIPEIGQIQAAGLTETQLEEEIRKSLYPGILKNPSVTVALRNSTGRAFTILGDGIATPGRYGIPRYDFRLLDALATAGSARQFNVSYIYVTRRVTGQEQIDSEIGAGGALNLKQVEQGGELEPLPNTSEIKEQDADSDLLEIIEPTFSRSQMSGLVIASAEMATDEELEQLANPENVSFEKDSGLKVRSGIEDIQQSQGRIEWIFRDGKWVPVKTEGGTIEDTRKVALPQPKQQEQIAEAPAQKTQPENFGWSDIQSGGVQSRVIRIPKDKLYGGDPRYNIVIKPQDTITAQLDVIGEFYVLGNVNNQGIINLTGRPMTLKMAIAAAGGLGQLAWPKKCEVVRRIGEKKEEIVMVDLEKIAAGTQPDFFIKPNDVINVGTHGAARYMYTLRNAFRSYYGFGFTYERNFNNRHLDIGDPFRLLHN
ncbi:MAG: polysaccharide biosynthesis/export family protein [Phycisphaerae bacterium]|nr:polysaccharide biosynthesis/export family protein [Phycisphaerae bacterium]